MLQPVYNKYLVYRADAGVATYTCTQNNEEAVVRVLEAVRPHICVFDRFVTEEQFGHYVERLSASAMRVVGE